MFVYLRNPASGNIASQNGYAFLSYPPDSIIQLKISLCSEEGKQKDEHNGNLICFNSGAFSAKDITKSKSAIKIALIINGTCSL